MREVNFSLPHLNKASVGITTALYDRRALDCTSNLPLINSLNHLAYLTTSSGRIRDILTVDGGIERLVCILKQGRRKDALGTWKWNLAFQCVVNIGVRGTEAVRTRVVEADVVPVIATILDNYLESMARFSKHMEELRQAHAEALRLRTASSQTQSPSLGPPPPPIPHINVNAPTPTSATQDSSNPSANSQQPPQRPALRRPLRSTPQASLQPQPTVSISVPPDSPSEEPSQRSFHSSTSTSASASTSPQQQPPYSRLQPTRSQSHPQTPTNASHTHSPSQPTLDMPQTGNDFLMGFVTPPPLGPAHQQQPTSVVDLDSDIVMGDGVNIVPGTGPTIPTTIAAATATVPTTNVNPGLVPPPRPLGRMAVVHAAEMAAAAAAAATNAGTDNNNYLIDGVSQPASPITPMAQLTHSRNGNPQHIAESLVRDTILYENPTNRPIRPRDILGRASSPTMSATGSAQDVDIDMPADPTVNIQDINMDDGETIGITPGELEPQGSETPTNGAINSVHTTGFDRSNTNTNAPLGLQPLVSTSIPRYHVDRALVSSVNTALLSLIPREEDVLMSLQLLAYVSKYSMLRTYFQNTHFVPCLRIDRELQVLDRNPYATAPLGPLDMEEEYPEEYLVPDNINIFPLVEEFTVRHHSQEMQYWAAVVMRNLCRKDDSRGGIRQCAYYKCGKWEQFTRQFAKCRRCRRTKYCSKECQKNAWAYHRHWCVAATASTHPPHTTGSSSMPLNPNATSPSPSASPSAAASRAAAISVETASQSD